MMILYGKFGKQKRFKAMDLKNCKQVGNLIYASLLTDTEGARVLKECTVCNPGWQFELRTVGRDL